MLSASVKNELCALGLLLERLEKEAERKQHEQPYGSPLQSEYSGQVFAFTESRWLLGDVISKLETMEE